MPPADTPSTSGTPPRADRAWKRALDWYITVGLGIPVLVLALPLELLGAGTGRCGNYAIRTTAD